MPLSIQQFQEAPEIPVTRTIDQQILELCGEKALTQKDLANEFGRKEQYIHRRLKALMKLGKLVRKKVSEGGMRPVYYYVVASVAGEPSAEVDR